MNYRIDRFRVIHLSWDNLDPLINFYDGKRCNRATLRNIKNDNLIINTVDGDVSEARFMDVPQGEYEPYVIAYGKTGEVSETLKADLTIKVNTPNPYDF